MSELIKQQLSNFSGLGGTGKWLLKARSAIALVIVAALVAVAVVLGLWQGNGEYRPLYGEHEQFDRAQVIAVLEEQGMDYYIEPQQGNVMIDRAVQGKARLALAAAGVEAQLPAGLEILGQDSSLGTSQFMESARYRHGLEGELARSIMALDAVSNVRVHLAIPKQTLFVRRNKEQASASVVVSLLPGKGLEPEQVSAIVNLVSGSVTELSAERVNVIDQHGNLLSALVGDSAGTGKASGAYLDYVQKLEQTYIERASRMLRPMLGMDNFRVEVAADINFDRTESTEERYAPEGVVRSEFDSFDRRAAEDATGIPGALSNQPPEEENEEQEGAVRNERGESSRDYLVDRTLKHTQFQQGTLERLSVSVLLNGEPSRFTPVQLGDIENMLADAMGVNTARGDSLSINVFPFNVTETEFLAEEPVWWMQPVWLDYLRYLLSAVVALVILLVVVRPVLRKLSGSPVAATPVTVAPTATNKARPEVAVEQQSAKDIAAVSPEKADAAESSALSSQALSSVVSNDPILAELPSPETGLEVQSSYLQMLSEKEPERVAHVVKQWISPKDADN